MLSNAITRRAVFDPVGSPTAEYLMTLSLRQAREQGDTRETELSYPRITITCGQIKRAERLQSPASCTARWTAGFQPYSGSARIRVMFCPDPGCHGMPESESG